MKKLKPIGTAFSHDYHYICPFIHFEKVKGDDGNLLTPVIIPLIRITMSNTFIDNAYAVVPEFENRISRFDKKLHIAQYAEHSIYDYKLKIAQAVLYLQKLPDDFTQDDVEERGMQDQMGGYLLICGGRTTVGASYRLLGLTKPILFQKFINKSYDCLCHRCGIKLSI